MNYHLMLKERILQMIERIKHPSAVEEAVIEEFRNYCNNRTDYSLFYAGNKLIKTIYPIDVSLGEVFNGMFSGSYIVHVPPLNTINGKNMYQMFLNCTLLEEFSLPYMNNVTNMYSFCQNCYELKRAYLGGTSKVTAMGMAFYRCRKLETIDTLDLTSVTDVGRTFTDCAKLKDLKITGTINVNNLDLRQSTELSVDSLLGILNALVDLTGQPTKTLYIGGTNTAKLTNEQQKIAIDKNWQVI